MNVMVSVASKHGATKEIGDVIAERLRDAHIEVEVMPPLDLPPLDDYDAFVLGSAVYMGRWIAEARDLISNNFFILRGKPVWLFSSGPITETSDADDSSEGDRLLAEVDGREHRVFAGKLEKNGLGWTERTIVRMVDSPWGDYRPWDEIRAWADSIAKELTGTAV